MDGEGLRKSLHPDEELLAVEGCWGREVRFFKVCALVNYVSVGGPIPIRAALSIKEKGT